MSDWDLSVCHCLPLSRENMAKVLRFVLGEKKGSPLPWRTKTHISSVLLFFSGTALKLRAQRIKRMKTWLVMAPHCSCCATVAVCVCPLWAHIQLHACVVRAVSSALSHVNMCQACRHLQSVGEILLHVGQMFLMVPTWLGPQPPI